MLNTLITLVKKRIKCKVLLPAKCMNDLIRLNGVSFRTCWCLWDLFWFVFVYFLRLRPVVVFLIRLVCLPVWDPAIGRVVVRLFITLISLLRCLHVRLLWYLFVWVFRDRPAPLSLLYRSTIWSILALRRPRPSDLCRPWVDPTR